MTTNNHLADQADAEPVIVMIGRPDDALADGLRTVGLAPIAHDRNVVIWGNSRLQPPPRPPEPTQTIESDRLLLTIADAAHTLGIGRSTLYELIGRGEIEVLHIGRSARIPKEALGRLVDRLRNDGVVSYEARTRRCQPMATGLLVPQRSR